MAQAACLPSSTAATVRSLPPATQSPPAQTPGREVARVSSTLILPPSKAIPSSPEGRQFLAHRLEDPIRRDHQRLARHTGIGEFDTGYLAAFTEIAARQQPGLDPDIAGARHFPFIGTGLHRRLVAAIGDGDILGPEQPGLHRDIDGGHAAADHHHPAPDGQRLALAEPGDEADRIRDAGKISPLDPHRIDRAKTKPEEDRIEFGRKRVELDTGAQRQTVLHLDPADAEDVIHLALGDIIDRLIGGDAIFIEAARLGPGFEDGHRMALHRQGMGAGKACRPGPDHRHRFPRRRALPEDLPAVVEQRIGRMALQAADLHRFMFRRVADTGFLAQLLRRADPGAHAAHDIAVEDGFRCAQVVAGRDLADEERNIDRGRAGGGTGRVVTEITTLRLDPGRMGAQGRVKIHEQAALIAPGAGRPPDRTIRHGRLPRVADGEADQNLIKRSRFIDRERQSFFVPGNLRRQYPAQQPGQLLPRLGRQHGKAAGVAGHAFLKGGLDRPAPLGGQGQQHAAPVVRIGQAADQAGGFEPVEYRGQGTGRQDRRFDQGFWRQGPVLPAQGRQDIELARLQAMAGADPGQLPFQLGAQVDHPQQGGAAPATSMAGQVSCQSSMNLSIASGIALTPIISLYKESFL